MTGFLIMINWTQAIQHITITITAIRDVPTAIHKIINFGDTNIPKSHEHQVYISYVKHQCKNYKQSQVSTNYYG